MVRSVAGALGKMINTTQEEIMYISAPLRLFTQTTFRSQNVIINQERTVVYFHEYIFQIIVVEKVLRHPCALCHPVQPQRSACSVYAVMQNLSINSSMKLNSSNLGTGELTLGPDIINVVIFNQAKGRTHAAAYRCLLAVVNGVIANNVRTYVFLAPTFTQSVEGYLDIMQ